jgi:hypothetical protein
MDSSLMESRTTASKPKVYTCRRGLSMLGGDALDGRVVLIDRLTTVSWGCRTLDGEVITSMNLCPFLEPIASPPMNRSVRLLAAPTCVTMLLLSTAACRAAPVLVGICTHEADKHNVEFIKYSRMLPVYRQNGVQASLVEMDGLYLRSVTEDKLVGLFRQYHVIQLTTTDEGMQKVTPEVEARARIAGAALARYVREGGGRSSGRSATAGRSPQPDRSGDPDHRAVAGPHAGLWRSGPAGGRPCRGEPLPPARRSHPASRLRASFFWNTSAYSFAVSDGSVVESASLRTSIPHTAA